MSTRLTPLEQTTLALDTARTPAVVGTVNIFDGSGGTLDHDYLQALIADRIRYVPRYRQRVRGVPLRLADPVWAEDVAFDLDMHVRHAVLQRPGNDQQLHDLVAHLLSARMDRSHPPWEFYLIDGLVSDRVALVSATHPCLVDGIDTVDLVQVLLDDEPDDTAPQPENWHPMPGPTDVGLMASAVTAAVRDPSQAATNAAHAVNDAFGLASTAGELACAGAAVDDLAADVLRGTRGLNTTVLSGSPGRHRRFTTATAELDDLHAVQTDRECSVHDVILAMITGGLRSWLIARNQILPTTSSLVAMTPTAVPEHAEEPTALGSQVAPHTVTLPVGTPDPLDRLRRISDGTTTHRKAEHTVDAAQLTGVAGFAPATLHSLGVRAAEDGPRQPYDLVISNAPGPQQPLYAGQAQLLESYPVIPISAGHLLAIGVTSYDGNVFYGLNADADAISDLDRLATEIRGALRELLLATGHGTTDPAPPRKDPDQQDQPPHPPGTGG
jgi:diacylglycerol O-acyltransferase